EVGRKQAERRAMRQQDGEVVQPEPAASRRPDSRTRLQPHERFCAAPDKQRRRRVTFAASSQAQHLLIEGDRSIQIAHLQAYEPDTGLDRQPECRWCERHRQPAVSIDTVRVLVRQSIWSCPRLATIGPAACGCASGRRASRDVDITVRYKKRSTAVLAIVVAAAVCRSPPSRPEPES